MGLLSKLALLPLAPVGGVIWLAEQLERQAYEQMYGPDALRAQMADLEERYQRGEVSAEEYRLGVEMLLTHMAESRSER